MNYHHHVLPLASFLLFAAPLGAVTETELVAEDGALLDRLGQAIAADGNLVVAGSTGDDDAGSRSGSAYLFDATTGVQLHKLTAPDAASGDEFGTSIDVSGNYIAVGVPDDDDAGFGSGSVWIFTIDQLDNPDYEPLKLTANDAASGDAFGNAVALDGNQVLVGAWKDGEDQGAAYLFDVTTGQQLQKYIANDAAPFDQFGGAVALSAGRVAIGAAFSDSPEADAGAVYLFGTSSSSQLGKLVAPDGTTGDTFGESLAMHDGKLLVGASNFDSNDEDIEVGHGRAYLFDVDSGELLLTLSDPAGEPGARFGVAVALGSRIVVGSDFASSSLFNSIGAVVSFELTGNFKSRLQRSHPQSGDFLGASVGLAGSLIVAGVPQADTQGSQSGSVILFDDASLAEIPPLQLTRSGQDNILSWAASPGMVYQLQYSTDLVDWHPLSQNLTEDNYTDVDALTDPTKFYQLTIGQ